MIKNRMTLRLPSIPAVTVAISYNPNYDIRFKLINENAAPVWKFNANPTVARLEKLLIFPADT